jgi:deazaflavin-dependent oxidoreductase (nitroreductase family)
MAADYVPGRWARFVAGVVGTRAGAWVMARTMHRLDSAGLRLSGGRWLLSARLAGLPVAMLTTTGRRSGQPRTAPVLAIPDGAGYILVASNWGQPTHPGWYHNLRANPDCVLTVGGEARRMRARQVTGEERARCWQRALAAYPGYAAYARRAGREIGVFVVESDKP